MAKRNGKDTALAPIDERFLTPAGKPIGMEAIDRDDLVLPRFKANCKDGVFTSSLDPEDERKGLTGILFAVRKGYVKWDPGDTSNPKPLCRSSDRKQGYDRLCEECEDRIWGKGGERPACAETYDFLLLEDRSTLPYGLTVARTSIKPAKNYITWFFTQKLPLFIAKTRIYMERVKGAKGTYFTVNFTKTGDTPEKQYGQLVKLWDQYKDRAVTEIEREEFGNREEEEELF